MFPIRDDNPQILTPVVTYGLIAATFATWLLAQGLGAAAPLARSVCELGLTPGELLGTVPVGTSVPLGRGYACTVTGDPHPLTLLSHMFLHGSWMHLLGNLWFLYVFGDNVEDAMGHGRFLVFYVACGLAAAAAQIVSAPASPTPMVGASGAIGGVMGAYVVLYPRVWVHLLVWLGFYVTRIAVPAYFMLGYWLVLQLIGGAFDRSEGGGIAFWAHVGGFAAGSALIFVFRRPELVSRHPQHGWRPSGPRRHWDRRRHSWS